MCSMQPQTAPHFPWFSSLLTDGKADSPSDEQVLHPVSGLNNPMGIFYIHNIKDADII